MDVEDYIINQAASSNIYKHGGNISQEASRLGLKPTDFLDASASLVPFALNTKIIRCIKKTLRGIDLRTYPDRNFSKLKAAISTWHGLEPSMVLPGNGASELITWAAREAKNHGISILPSPGFGDYKRALKCWDSPFSQIPLPLIWDSSFPQPFPINGESKAIWVTNPHNPTGQLWSRNSLEKLLKSDCLVICDEAFLPLVPNGEKQSLVPLLRKYQNLIVIKSLTKLFSIAGIRLGYALSSPKRLQKWEACRDPWPMNGIAIAIGTMLMSDQHLMKQQTQKVQQWISQEGFWLHSKLQCLPGITAHPSATNFQLIQSNNSLDFLREELAKKKILIRSCHSFEGLGETWLRISLQKRLDNIRIINEMKKILS